MDGSACSKHGRDAKYTQNCVRDYFGDMGVYRRIILK
jgi:hypothetical protein